MGPENSSEEMPLDLSKIFVPSLHNLFGGGRFLTGWTSSSGSRNMLLQAADPATKHLRHL
jgi:hypothetical protein